MKQRRSQSMISRLGWTCVVLASFCVTGCASKRIATLSHYAHQKTAPTKTIRTTQRANRARPGLGTAYGRSVYAPIRYVGFKRASAGPSAVMRLYYNDPQGVMAMARYVRGRRCCGPVAVRDSNGVSLQLVDPAHGSTLSGLAMAGKTVVIGRHGRHYHILLRNHTGRRKELVVSVDGLDVIDGRPAKYHKRGYILRPYGILRIKGFRRSRSQVAAFRFSTVRGSYAARRGRGGNVGVIGAAIFEQRSAHWQRRELQRRLNADPFSAPPSHMVR